MILFAHYGLGLNNGFSRGGQNERILRLTYFTLLLSYMSFAILSHVIKAYKGILLEDQVGGRICLLKR